ncbi:DUF4097 family beta strand repeat-containing protein [Eubacterium oxidoreducens]|uniref:Putative adhesin n=1 Tax=Eubacterium oxidoreducens TaxID=1732 RepID=A0A1G6CEN8_EUBOX|nr:DUF4097 family beta strand repeat-containing protein [Eubacterium oxidoreducens]SDB31285.1 Putative adhesin [Eubacterium oxidoreducens]
MYKRKKMIAGIILIAAVMLMACGKEQTQEDAGSDSGVGEEKTVSKAVEEILVNWTAGEVKVQYGDVKNITFSESSKQELSEDTTLQYEENDKELSIEYAKTGNLGAGAIDKTLVITLPDSYVCKRLKVELVSADLILPSKIQIEECEIHSDSGTVVLEGGGSVKEMNCETVSGNIELELDEIDTLVCDSVSADVTLLLPKDSGFRVDTEMIGGEFVSDFETKQKGEIYTAGDAGAGITMTSLSGDLTIGIGQ